MNYKKNTLIFLTTAISLLISVVIFNYKMDPAGIFKPLSYEYGIAQIMLDGKNAANLSNFDERLVLKYFLDNVDVKPKTVVLGSSRSMLISPNVQYGKEFFNSSVSGASLEDVIAIYGIYDENNIKPQKIVVCLEPWFLNKGNGQSVTPSLQKEYNYELTQMKIKTDIAPTVDFRSNKIKRIKELISMPYFLASCDKLKKISKKEVRSEYFATKSDDPSEGAKRKDGTLTYPSYYKDVPLSEINKRAAETDSKDFFLISDYHKLSKTEIFEAFVQKMRCQGTHLVFYLPPYHPFVYSTINSNSKYHGVEEAEGYFHNLAKKMNIPIVGSYNPAKMNISEKDFYDGVHLKEATIKKMNILQY